MEFSQGSMVLLWMHTFSLIINFYFSVFMMIDFMYVVSLALEEFDLVTSKTTHAYSRFVEFTISEWGKEVNMSGMLVSKHFFS